LKLLVKTFTREPSMQAGGNRTRNPNKRATHASDRVATWIGCYKLFSIRSDARKVYVLLGFKLTFDPSRWYHNTFRNVGYSKTRCNIPRRI